MNKKNKAITAICMSIMIIAMLLIQSSANPWFLPHTNFIVYTPHHVSLTADYITQEFPDSILALIDNQTDQDYLKPEFPQTEKIEPASGRYNCHSYAWYQTNTSNTVWFDFEPVDFVDCAVPVPSWQVLPGDIVIFVDEDGTIQHSAIVVSTVNGFLNTALLQSKWGDAGIYNHGVYTGHPYAGYDVEVYRKQVHNQTYTSAGNTHIVTCSCGAVFSENHNYVGNGISYRCKQCGHTIYIRYNDQSEETD